MITASPRKETRSRGPTGWKQSQSTRAAAAAYADLLVDGDTSFAALTLEETVDAAFAHGGPVKEAFVRRYLW
ncbi:hypothetical protein ACFWQC_02790 [Nocardioides sp. NPDC058538]|uniref:hypothetical protein n=1 Tax=Nocardioides sp. NPDC058538 TaxID=3346542 RepID=UPI0036659DB2